MLKNKYILRNLAIPKVDVSVELTMLKSLSVQVMCVYESIKAFDYRPIYILLYIIYTGASQ